MKQYFDYLLSYLPRPLPVGMKEFNDWSDRIIKIAGQFADADSMKFALASQIIHLNPQIGFVSDQYFVKSLRKSAANQVASQVFQDIKTKQKEAFDKQQAAALENQTSGQQKD